MQHEEEYSCECLDACECLDVLQLEGRPLDTFLHSQTGNVFVGFLCLSHAKTVRPPYRGAGLGKS